MGVKVTFLGDEPAKNTAPVLLVPSDAVQDDAGKKIVFLYKDGHVERRAVNVGNPRDTNVEVLAGLHDGDQVVVKGAAGLHDGDGVQVKE
jgi:membrane fusion protein (multidrug efflux system)